MEAISTDKIPNIYSSEILRQIITRVECKKGINLRIEKETPCKLLRLIESKLFTAES